MSDCLPYSIDYFCLIVYMFGVGQFTLLLLTNFLSHCLCVRCWTFYPTSIDCFLSHCLYVRCWTVCLTSIDYLVTFCVSIRYLTVYLTSVVCFVFHCVYERNWAVTLLLLTIFVSNWPCLSIVLNIVAQGNIMIFPFKFVL